MILAGGEEAEDMTEVADMTGMADMTGINEMINAVRQERKTG